MAGAEPVDPVEDAATDGSGPLTDAPEDDPITVALTDALRRAVDAHGVPGAVAGVVLGGTRHVAGVGVGSSELPRPVDGDTLFQVGSITKTLTSAAVMLLVEEGRLSLPDPVESHIPGLGEATGLDTEAITVEVALSHRAGFDGDHLFVEGGSEGLAILATARRFFDPDDGWSYNNAGFSIVGEVIAATTGVPYETFVRERLLAPLGMVTAGFRADEVVTRDVAAPHWVFDGSAYVLRGIGWQPGWELTPLDRAAGGLVASANHLLEWCRFQWTGRSLDGARLISDESLRRLRTPVSPEVMPGISVGLDWYVREHGCHDGGRATVTTVEHGGTTVGYVSELLVAPEQQVGLVCLTNATNGAGVVHDVRRAMLPELLGVVEEDPVVDPDVVPDVGRLVGTYEHSFATLTVTAGERAGTIVITPSPRAIEGWRPPVTGPVTLGFRTPSDAVAIGEAPPAKTALFDPDGDPAQWVLWDHRRAPRTA